MKPPTVSTEHLEHEVVEAIRASWTLATSADPERWSPERPAIGQCDVSSYVAWRYLGGDLVLCDVLVDGQLQERHYFNRFDGRDVDLTIEQFDGHEQIVETSILSNDEILERSSSMRSELATRIEHLHAAVAARLGVPA